MRGAEAAKQDPSRALCITGSSKPSVSAAVPRRDQIVTEITAEPTILVRFADFLAGLRRKF
jgi:hypothetical protein